MNGSLMRFRFGLLCSVGVLTLALAGCGKSVPINTADDDYQTGKFVGRTESSIAGGEGGISIGLGDTPNKNTGGDTSGGGSGLGVNAYLWRGALDTLSFMPLASADPFGGVIITDWYQPPSSTGERFKATAYILGRQLRADGIRVALFRQVQQSGQWVDAPVSQGTTSELENKVLARARELRSQPSG